MWSALAEVYPETRAQRCWVHKTANVLDRLPKRVQGEAKSMLHEIWGSDTRERAKEAFECFCATWEAKYPKAAECLARDREELLASLGDFASQVARKRSNAFSVARRCDTICTDARATRPVAARGRIRSRKPASSPPPGRRPRCSRRRTPPPPAPYHARDARSAPWS